MTFIPEIYGPVFSALLREERLMPLGPGEPAIEYFDTLSAMRLDTVFKRETVSDGDAANACLAGMWLYYNFLDESHKISQVIESRECNFWHGIMHRREGDFWNSGYWFRRVGKHPVFPELRVKAAAITKEIGSNTATSFLIYQDEWDPLLFIELVEKYRGTDTPSELICRRIQLAEFRLLFDYCYHKATGR